MKKPDPRPFHHQASRYPARPDVDEILRGRAPALTTMRPSPGHVSCDAGPESKKWFGMLELLTRSASLHFRHRADCCSKPSTPSAEMATAVIPVEQYMRDVNIAAIYECTNGIQALDLVGRKRAPQGRERHEPGLRDHGDHRKAKYSKNGQIRRKLETRERPDRPDHGLRRITARARASCCTLNASTYLDIFGDGSWGGCSCRPR